MLKNPFQVAITFSIVALIIKLVIFSLNLQHGDMENYIRYIYMLVLLVAVFFGIRSSKIDQPNTTFLQDFKAGARTAAFFALIVAGITYIYYAKIDVDFFMIKQAPVLEELTKNTEQAIKDGVDTKEVIVSNYSNQLFSVRTFLSPYFQAMWTMFGLVFMGLFNALIFALLMKKMPGFKM